jgi:hypothetical protein
MRRRVARRGSRGGSAPTPPAPRAEPAPRPLQLCSYLDKYTKAIVVHADNVGSNQLMMIRKARARAAAAGGGHAGRAARGRARLARRDGRAGGLKP